MHTTSHPQRRSRGRDAVTSHPSPIKRIVLRVQVFGAAGGDLKRLAAEKGLTAKEDGSKVSLTIETTTPEDALAQLALLRGLLASKP